jgi:phosphotriesterase-related protein
METLRRFPDRLLISQDAGWYNVGQPRGGQVTSFDWLPRAFIPMLVAAGVSAEGVNRLLVQNPAAFTIRAADE